MTEEERVRKYGKLYEQILSERSDDDYEVDQEQMDKLLDILGFMIETAESCNGTVEPIKLRPRELHGGVTAEFRVFDLYGESLREFSEVIRGASAFSIDSLTDGRICLSVTVPRVFRHK